MEGSSDMHISRKAFRGPVRRHKTGNIETDRNEVGCRLGSCISG
jgi:hypothetical protein